MRIDEKFSLILSQEEGILLLTSARLLDRLVAGVTIHAQDRDELIRGIINKLSRAVKPELAVMSDQLASAIVESVLGLDQEWEDDEASTAAAHWQGCHHDFIEASPDNNGSLNYPVYAVENTLPLLQKALLEHSAVKTKYYSFARESVDLLTLNPISIKRENGLWHMVAYSHELDDIMVFRVDCIKEALEVVKPCAMPKRFDLSKQSNFVAYR